MSTFFYQGSLFWNKLYKKLLDTTIINLHKAHKLRGDNSNTEIVLYDYSTNVSKFKSKLRETLLDKQNDDGLKWNYSTNYLSNN